MINSVGVGVGIGVVGGGGRSVDVGVGVRIGGGVGVGIGVVGVICLLLNGTVEFGFYRTCVLIFPGIGDVEDVRRTSV